MSSGKHASNGEKEFGIDFELIQNIIVIILILAVIIGIIFGITKLLKKMQETQTEETSSNVSEESVDESEYPVLGKIVIDKISVEQPILDSVEDKALEEGVIKLYGNDLNKPGNFCIAGHNYSNIFKNLEELEIGDEITIIDKNNQNTTYKTTEISSVEPTDLSLLKSEEGKTQITLITCENYSTQRLVVKAELAE